MNPIDVNNPTADLQQPAHDPAGQRMGRIYGDATETLRLQGLVNRLVNELTAERNHRAKKAERWADRRCRLA